MGLFPHGSMLIEQHNYEEEIEGTEEELRYYSHDSSDHIEENSDPGTQVFSVGKEPERSHSEKCDIHIINKEGEAIGGEWRRSPVTLNTLNALAQTYHIKKYVLKDNKGKLIKGAGIYSVREKEIFLQDLDSAIWEFHNLKKKKVIRKKVTDKKLYHIDARVNPSCLKGMSCKHCGKSLLPGQLFTIDKDKQIVHFDCEGDYEKEIAKARLSKLTKNELITDLKRILENEFRHNDYAMISDIKDLICY